MCAPWPKVLINTLNNLKIPTRSWDNAKYTILCFGGGHVVLVSLSTVWIFLFKFLRRPSCFMQIRCFRSRLFWWEHTDSERGDSYGHFDTTLALPWGGGGARGTPVAHVLIHILGTKWVYRHLVFLRYDHIIWNIAQALYLYRVCVCVQTSKQQAQTSTNKHKQMHSHNEPTKRKFKTKKDTTKISHL